MDAAFWAGTRVFVTGHTGFKGSWLTLWLHCLGAEVTGYALEPPTRPSLFTEARVGDVLTSVVGDVRDLSSLREALLAARPEIVLHLAAQPLVRASYADPVETYSTNVMGTVHLLEAVRACPEVRVVVNVTSDKVYENVEMHRGYRESDTLGGHDPYSSSKGCSELVTAAFRHSFLADVPVAVASARAGNVIGGGDWAADRLVPDLLKSYAAGQAAEIRNPGSTRPWQHVLEPLSGYLALAERLSIDGGSATGGWNFGPRTADAKPVSWIADTVAAAWGGDAQWQTDDGVHPSEATYLHLDVTRAREELGWGPRWSIDRALEATVEWHRSWAAGVDPRGLVKSQLAEYTHSPLLEDQ